MKNSVKNLLLLTAGFGGGFLVCGITIVGKALESDDIRGLITKKLSDKIYKLLYGKEESDQEIIFNTYDEAANVLDELREIIDKYGYASVANLKDLTDVSSTYTDIKYGWTNLDKAEVKPARISYTITLPKPLPIN